MHKVLYFFVIFCALISESSISVAGTTASNYMSANTYNNMYPYMNNKMRTSLNPGVNPTQANAQISVLARTSNTPTTTTRRVVSRGSTTARSGTVSGTANAARSATTTNNNARRVVARGNTARSGIAQNTQNYASANTRSARGDNSYTSTSRTSGQNVPIVTDSTDKFISSSRCLADYTECMNGYCQREKTAYNRCYCSAKLSQIDSMYQPAIDKLIREILTLKGTNNWTDEEMNEYWMDTVGKYSGENSWTNLDNALNIDWAGTESRVRGQQAFATGHEYCVQHLQGCYYMATNLRDAYRSEIARDCATYETSLQKIKNVAESIVESFK